MLNSEIVVYYIYSGIFLSGYFLGQYRKSTDKDEIENLIKSAHIAMSENFLAVLNNFNEKMETVNSGNTKLINEQNALAITAINTQVRELNRVYELLANMNITLRSQSELYERINMLQKIIVKKKKLDNK